MYLFCLQSLSLPLTLTGGTAREEMMKSKLPNSVLRRIWALSDIDNDGHLDRDEFALAMFLLDHKLSGNDLPDVLPEKLVPPSKRMLFKSHHYGGGGARGGGGGDVGGVSSSGYSSGGGHPGKQMVCVCVCVYWMEVYTHLRPRLVCYMYNNITSPII